MLRNLALLGPALLALSPHASTNALSLLTLGRSTLHAHVGYVFILMGGMLIRIGCLMLAGGLSLNRMIGCKKAARWVYLSPVALCAFGAMIPIPAGFLPALRLAAAAASFALLLPKARSRKETA